MTITANGDADIAPVAALFGEPTRARILTALLDGRALPAGMLAIEAGVSPQTASAQLARLLDAGVLTVEPQGRRRYYRLANRDVAHVIEALSVLAKPRPVRSLREGTRAQALRTGRTCYDHLAGRLGVSLTATLVNRGALVTDADATGTAAADADGDGDGDAPPAHDTLTRTDTDPVARRDGDPIAAPLRHHPYRIGPAAGEVCAAFGVDLSAVTTQRGDRPLLRFCVDWTEQRHHLAGRLGAAFAAALVDQGWIERGRIPRAMVVTDLGAKHLATLGCEL